VLAGGDGCRCERGGCPRPLGYPILGGVAVLSVTLGQPFRHSSSALLDVYGVVMLLTCGPARNSTGTRKPMRAILVLERSVGVVLYPCACAIADGLISDFWTHDLSFRRCSTTRRHNADARRAWACLPCAGQASATDSQDHRRPIEHRARIGGIGPCLPRLGQASWKRSTRETGSPRENKQ